jgi:serpin B
LAFENVDFKHKYEQNRVKINKEVSAATNNKINNLLSKGSIDKDTLMLLVNSIYFKGDWLKPFKSDKTQTMDFHFGDKSKG